MKEGFEKGRRLVCSEDENAAYILIKCLEKGK
jgi:hypothetical protein